MRGTKNFSMGYINGIKIMVAPKFCHHPNMGSLFPQAPTDNCHALSFMYGIRMENPMGRGVWADGSVFHTY